MATTVPAMLKDTVLPETLVVNVQPYTAPHGPLAAISERACAAHNNARQALVKHCGAEVEEI